MAATNGSDAGSDSGGAALPDNPNILDGGIDEQLPLIDGDGTPGNPRDPAASVKRGRGRPRKDGSNGTDAGTRSNGNPSGGESFGKKPTKLDVELFATQIVGAHAILANLTKNPLLNISQKEAESLALAIKNLLVFHKISLSPSTVAYIQFIGACLAIYGPRLMIIVAAKKAQKDQEKNTFENGVAP